jgi:hypothetical protein
MELMEHDKTTHYKCAICKRFISIKQLQQHCLTCAKNFGIKCGNCSRRIANKNYEQHIRACFKLYNNTNNTSNDYEHTNFQLTTAQNKTFPTFTNNANANMFTQYNLNTTIANQNECSAHSEHGATNATKHKRASINGFEIIDTLDDFTNSIQLIP